MLLWNVWTSDDAEQPTGVLNQAEPADSSLLTATELVPNYLLAGMDPWRESELATEEKNVRPEAPPVEVALANLVSKPKASKYTYKDAGLSLKLQRLLDDYRVPDGAVIVLDTVTGEIAGLAGVRGGVQDHSAAFEAKWPAASLFKILCCIGIGNSEMRGEAEGSAKDDGDAFLF